MLKHHKHVNKKLNSLYDLRSLVVTGVVLESVLEQLRADTVLNVEVGGVLQLDRRRRCHDYN